MRVIFTLLIVFSFLFGSCAPHRQTNKTKISQKYHKKEYPKNQANINSLNYSSSRKTKPSANKPGFFRKVFPKKKSYYAGN